MGKWKPQDDFQLIQSVIQLNDLSDVHEVTKFTRKFSLKEIRDRWNAILYDAPISRLILCLKIYFSTTNWCLNLKKYSLKDDLQQN